MNQFTNNPMAYFSSANGPYADDYYGPPASVLQLYGDGTAMNQAQQQTAEGAAHWWQRADVHAGALTLLGAWMVWRYTK